MKYWAKLDNNRVVTEVTYCDEETIALGYLGHPSNWVETSPTGEFRKTFARVGFTYDLLNNVFYPPNPNHPDAIWDEDKWGWFIPNSSLPNNIV